MKQYNVLHRTLIKGDYKDAGALVRLTEDEAKPLLKGKLIMDAEAYEKAQASDDKVTKDK